MKNKVICKQLELIHISDIEKMDKDQVEFKPDKNFIRLALEDKAVYTNQSQLTEAGVTLEETISARIKSANDLTFINTALKYYVLRLHTDSGTFLVGSTEYPAILTYSDNKVTINLTFKSSKPI